MSFSTLGAQSIFGANGPTNVTNLDADGNGTRLTVDFNPSVGESITLRDPITDLEIASGSFNESGNIFSTGEQQTEIISIDALQIQLFGDLARELGLDEALNIFENEALFKQFLAGTGFTVDDIDLNNPADDVLQQILNTDLSTITADFQVIVAPVPGAAVEIGIDNFAVSLGLPGVGTSVGDVELSIPFIETTGGPNGAGTALTSSGEDDLFGIDLDVDALVPFIPVGGFTASFGPLSAGVDVFDIDFGPDIDVTQDFTLTPDELLVTFDLSEEAEIDGVLTNMFTTRFDELGDIDIRLFAETTFSPTFVLDAMLASSLGLDIDQTFTIEGLSASLGLTPFQVDIGPLISADIDVDPLQVELELFSNTFEVDEFAAVSGPSFTLTPLNRPPDAVDDAVSVGHCDAPVISVLDNDTDPEGDTLTIVDFDASGVLGQVINNGDGTFTYNSNGQFAFLGAGETATETFTYTIDDGFEGQNTATVTVTIEGDDNLYNAGTAFSFSQGANGGSNRFGYDGEAFFISGQGVRGRPKFDDFDDFLAEAARVFDGVIERSGNINDQRLDEGDGPNNIRVNANDEVTIGGRSIGGSYRIQFDNTTEAETFRDFVVRMLDEIDMNDVVAADPEDFRFDAADLRVFFDKTNDEFGFTADLGATQERFETLEEAVEGLAAAFGGVQSRDGNFNAVRIADGQVPNNVRVNGNDQVIVAGRSTSGRFTFDLESTETAETVADALRELFANVDEADAIAIGDQPAPAAAAIATLRVVAPDDAPFQQVLGLGMDDYMFGIA